MLEDIKIPSGVRVAVPITFDSGVWEAAEVFSSAKTELLANIVMDKKPAMQTSSKKPNTAIESFLIVFIFSPFKY